ncbi:serine hydrolase domain-containing protein [Streptomyces sp. NPDC097981]|uniref:serine hydrolase domain-containing protein n=1 Tax=Streptomyces sp. NPDC097981 TaxID=3155428 RepID=UPI00331C5C57
MSRIRTALLCTATLIAATLQATGAAAAPAPGTGREPPPEPCVSSPGPARGEARQVLDIARQAQKDLGVKAVVLRVTRDGQEVVTGALGESMTGVPATADMHFRSGSVAIAYMGDVLLQLVDEHRVGLDDPVSRWLPDLPHGDEITLRMLAASTSGLHDYVTDPKFLAALEAAPFRQWTPKELVGYPLAHPLRYEPGTNWSYSHANFVLLGAALEKITGIRLDRLLQQRIMSPLGLSETRNSYTPEIGIPVLHAFTSERSTYEESTFWNPSWTTAPGAVENTNVCDLARSAVAIGSGELLSPAGYRVSLDPGTVGLGKPTAQCPAAVCRPMTPEVHFGLGLIVQNGWILQNPSFSGYASIQAYLPSDHLAIAVSTTLGPEGAQGNTAQTIAYRIADALSPGHPIQK